MDNSHNCFKGAFGGATFGSRNWIIRTKSFTDTKWYNQCGEKNYPISRGSQDGSQRVKIRRYVNC